MEPINRLLWDPWNIAHVARHGVTQHDVEEACARILSTRNSYGGRILLIGSTSDNRILAVVLEPEGSGEYYVVTARPASRRERRPHQEGTG